MKKNFNLLALVLLMVIMPLTKANSQSYISFEPQTGAFDIANADVMISDNDFKTVKIAANNLCQDIFEVTGRKPTLNSKSKLQIIAGTLGSSVVIDKIVKTKKIDVSAIKGKWETTIIQVVEKPISGVDKALVIIGSDRRATVFGIYDISKNIGVSPWKYWADVPSQQHKTLCVNTNRIVLPSPKVKYRGLFLNDEEPCLGRWAVEKFGGFNHEFYSHLFELLLRLKCNFMWPAMWWAAFNADDELNAQTADDYAIVMGTSHHEPMNKAYAEWHNTPHGAWDYSKNPKELEEFWEDGIKRIGNKEVIVTLAMRGDGDEAMSENANISLLENIVKVQREIIEKTTKQPAEKLPQVWALYKEVQEYYDNGMTVPDDVTLLLCDDNWGNIRRLPDPKNKPRKGGYGIYWHYDYVGGPRSYRWLNTNQLEHFWDQYDLALEYGADRLWIMNVGDIKPMELPISFFAEMAYNPAQFNHENVADYPARFASEVFNSNYDKLIGNILDSYARINARKKPELLNDSAISPNQLYTTYKEYQELKEQADFVSKYIPENQQNAYYQLVQYPIDACSNLYKMYFYKAANKYFAKRGSSSLTNMTANIVDECFEKDAEITKKYNTFNGGKWNHFADETHIGYFMWDHPKTNIKPRVTRLDKDNNAKCDFQDFIDYCNLPNDYISILAKDFVKSKNSAEGNWIKINKGGGFESAVSYYPSTIIKSSPDKGTYLEYEFVLNEVPKNGEIEITTLTSPTLDFLAHDIEYAISVDGENPQMCDIHADKTIAWATERLAWSNSVINYCYQTKSTHKISQAGRHTLRIYLTDASIVFEEFRIK
ncbi:MAG: glycosyl hydrolase 115 family protein [Bacteroidales bacterium]|nr:glycosyl hydrolase 115 family protein [Bacteroidales bacterium]